MIFYLSENVLNEISQADNIKYKRKYYAKLYDFIESNIEDIFVSFRTDNFVTSINPNNVYGTPTGLYTYPLKFFKEEFLKQFYNSFASNSINTNPIFSETLFPYIPGGSKHLNIYVLKNKTGIVTSDDDSINIINKNINIIRKFYNKFKAKEQYSYDILENEYNMRRFISNVMSNPHYRSNMSLLYLLLLNLSGGNMTRLRNIFTSMGINGLIDYGTGTIHPSEPYQAVFFKPKSSLKMIGQIDKTYDKAYKVGNEIDLSNNNIYALDGEFNKFSKHRGALDLSDNKIEFLNDVGSLNATEIDLSNNKLIRLSGIFMPNLKKIDLSNNYLYNPRNLLRFLKVNKKIVELNVNGNEELIKDEDFNDVIKYCNNNKIRLKK